MAVVNTKTSSLTAADLAGDTVANVGRALTVAVAAIEVAAGDDNGSTYRLLRVPSDAVLVSMEIAADALGTSATFDLGVYEIAANGGAAVDADEFASDLVLSSATTWTHRMEEADATDIAKIGQPLWQRLGLAADTGKAYDIVATGDTNGDAAGTIALRVTYYRK